VGKKLGNLKRFIAAVLLCAAATFCLYSQSQNTESLTEDSIVLTESETTENPVIVDYKGTSTVGTFVRMIVALIIVIGLIYGVLWFIKRKTNVVKTDDDYLRRAAYINIAPNKTVEVITLLDKAYLIGVTEDNISLLGEIEDKELIEAMNINADKKADTKKPVNFTQVLDSLLIKNKNTKNIFADTETKVDEIFSNRNENSGE